MQDDGGRFPIIVIIIIIIITVALIFPAPPKINAAVKRFEAPEGKCEMREKMPLERSFAARLRGNNPPNFRHAPPPCKRNVLPTDYAYS